MEKVLDILVAIGVYLFLFINDFFWWKLSTQNVITIVLTICVHNIKLNIVKVLQDLLFGLDAANHLKLVKAIFS